MPKVVQCFFKIGQPSNNFTIKTHVRKNSLLIVEDTGVVVALLMAPKAIGRDLWLRVWVLVLVKEGIVCSEAVHAERSWRCSSTWKPWQPWLRLMSLRPLLNMVVVLWSGSSWRNQNGPSHCDKLAAIVGLFNGVRPWRWNNGFNITVASCCT